MSRETPEELFSQIRSVAAYSPYLWPHAVAALRYVRPIQEAGLTMIPGMEGDGIYPERVSQADIVVIQREFPLYWEQHEQILSLARTQGKPVVYELDDLLLELPDVHPDRAIDFYTPAILPILHAITSSDLVTTTTPTLREYLIQFNPNVMVLPNYLDDHIWQMRSPVKDLHDFPVVIGYMGSDTHQPDLDILIPVFLNLVNRYGEKIRFRFWGCQPPEVIRQLSNTDWLPLQIFDYPKFAEYLGQQECDIVLAPLLDSLFNRCKSPVKLFEYSTIGAPGVFSHLDPFESVIVQGENGFLASSPEEWETYLRQLIEDPTLRSHLGSRMQETVKQSWLLSQHASLWMDAYKHAQILQRRGEASQRAETIRTLRNMASQSLMMHRKQSLEVAQRDQTIHNMLKQLDQAQADLQEKSLGLEMLSDLHRQLTATQNQLKEAENRLQEAQKELDEIHRSNAWVMVQALWRIRLALLPKGSTRDKFFRRDSRQKNR